jgi:hypothetical protein
MSLLQRIILSLLVSIILFSAFVVVVFTGLFDVVEARFYNPRVIKGINREITENARAADALLNELRDRFTGTLTAEAVRRSFLPNQAREDILERARIYGDLLHSAPGLRTVRFVDAGGARIHFSTLADDVLRQDGSSLSYRGYRECPDVLPYPEVETPEQGEPRFIFDGPGERLIFSCPFTDSMDVYRGSALFTFSVRTVTDYLIREGRIEVGEDISVVSSPGGFLFGLPAMENGGIKHAVALLWDEGILSLSNLDEDGGESLALLSARSAGGFWVGYLVQESLFTFPPAMKALLLTCFFLTVFLLSFLVCNLRQDSTTVIRTRLKRLQDSLIRQYYETKEEMDWKYWSRELEQRREDVRNEIQRGLSRTGKNPAAQADLDTLFDRSWDELIAAAGGRGGVEFDKEQLRALVTEALRQALAAQPGAGLSPPAPESPVTTAPAPAGLIVAAGTPGGFERPEELSELEELFEPEELEELEGPGESEDTEPAGPEPPEELGPVEELPAAEPAATEQVGAEPVEKLEKTMKEESAGLEPPEELEPLEVEELDEAEEPPEAAAPGKRGGEDAGGPEDTVVTPAAFEREEPEAELEPLEELPAEPSAEAPGEAPPLDPNVLASQIEFGPGAGEAEEAEDEVSPMELDMSSPFDSLSFESPHFSGAGGAEANSPGETAPEAPESPELLAVGDPGGPGKKKRNPKVEQDDTGLEEITEEGGLPFIYQPFLFQGNQKPILLRPLAEPGESIREEDGIHLVNSDILDPNQESDRNLDPKFLHLVESIIGGKIPRPKDG